MNMADAMWKVFENTGHVGAYLIYRDYTIDAYTDENGETIIKETVKANLFDFDMKS